MPNPYRERGGKNRPSRKTYVEPKHNNTTLAMVQQEAVFNAHFETNEIERCRILGIKPRRSLTQTQYLGVLPEKVEFEQLHGKQIDLRRLPTDRYKQPLPLKDCTYNQIVAALVEVNTRSRITWKSDKNLLNLTKVDQFGTQKDRKGNVIGTAFKRETSKSKRRIYMPEIIDEATFDSGDMTTEEAERTI